MEPEQSKTDQLSLELATSINAFVPPRVNSGSCWHYTSIEGLLGILSSNSFWASSARSINDSSELSFGYDQLRATFEGFEDDSKLSQDEIELLRNLLFSEFINELKDKVFIFSASREPDLLSQWSRYAGMDGFSIEIDLSKPLQNIGADPSNPSKFRKGDIVVPGWTTVEYPKDENSLAIQSLKSAINKNLKKSSFLMDKHRLMLLRIGLMINVVGLKHSGFAEEQEIRFISGRTDSIGNKYRIKNRVLKSYIEIGPFSENQESEEISTLLPIKNVICGPNFPESQMVQIKEMLNFFGYVDVEVSHSKIPFVN